MKNRIGIYFFYDAEGIVDDYVIFYLEHLRKFCSELCVVVNEPLTIDGRLKLEKVCDNLLIRPNIGFDSQAYKYAMEYYGYGKLKEYDELILCNFTCYGPVYPFQEMFDKMEISDCDFWGITKYPRNNIVISSKQKTSYVPEHIMSYFITIKSRILRSDCFKYYWDTIEIPNNYEEAVVVNELRFTDYFERRGFKSDILMTRETIDGFSENSATFTPVELLKLRCPLLKRRAFCVNYDVPLVLTDTTQAMKALEFVKENSDYDVNLIWDNLLRTNSGSLLKRNLHLNYFLDENHFYGDENILKNTLKVAMVLYSYYEDMDEYALSYAQNLPSWVDIYIYVTSEKGKNIFEKSFSKLPNKVSVEIKENRGQLASVVLISAKKVFEKYDLVCVTQTKKTLQLGDKHLSEAFCNHCWYNVLGSKNYVLNLIQKYCENSRLGYSCAIPPHWGAFQNLIGNEIVTNKDNMEDILKQFNIPISKIDEEPIASYGECYWVRTKGYKKLLDYNWKYTDFPEADKTPKDGCILNALERLMPIFVQEQGYYPAWIVPISVVSIYFDNIYYMLREKNIQYNKSILSFQTLKLLQNSLLHMSIILFLLKLQKIKCHFMTKITYGKRKQHYKDKKKKIREILQCLKK